MKKNELSPFLNIHNTIDRNSPVPLYYQISEAILGFIRKEQLEINARIPPEEKLAELFSVSKMTMRQALAKLVNDGVLTRRKGSGTFVAEKKIERRATRLVSFHEDIKEKGLDPGSRVIEKRVVTATPNLIEKLGVTAEEPIIRIIRLRFANDLPLAVNYAYIPERMCPGLLDEDLTQRSLSAIIDNKYHLGIEYAEQNIQAVKSTTYEATLLGVKTGDPLLFMERIMYDRAGRPVSYYYNLFRGDKYTFSSVLYK